eukprot:CAMPEP_0183754816 /NCGR_PEP_ID=MMETSP0739-20130205/3731_1 /TAXON_ID=385413 /ORGANISM="Thalassiosira miniscula, Strain CCMP1093" /LENGTH=1540 /DNA_ID=CAMNT_0025991459 /DNA_START=38 /DNA_END=4660 /DNA_ORIENTATION=+
MLFKVALFALTSLAFNEPSLVKGHGYLTTPRSRNFYAHDIIGSGECTGQVGCPPGEYCHHCLNTNEGVCGKSTTINYETTSYFDKAGNPMPWLSQGTYEEGGLIQVDSYLDTHHNGHMEIRACVTDDADPSKCTTPQEFEGNELIFVRDLIHPDAAGMHTPMYPDPNYPERGMYAGGQGGSIKAFSFEYQLPSGISGEKVMLNWKYITANSCSPPGYAEYFAAHPDLPDSYWTQGVSLCTPPYPNDGTRSTTWPEQFFNCAEVSILPGGTAGPTISPKPTQNPTTAQPTVSKSPTGSPIVGGPPPCLNAWQDCTYDWNKCCEGFKCTQVDAAGYGRCLEDTCDEGPSPPSPPTTPPPPNPWTPSPTPIPTPNPTSPTGNPPTSGGDGCCTINLKTCHHDEGTFCDLNQENCEGPCGKIWLPNGPLEGCIALWEGGCSSDADCCQWGECREGSCESDDPWNKGGGTSSPTKFPTPAPTGHPTEPQPTNAPTTPNPTSPPTPPVPTKTPTNYPTNEPTTPAPQGSGFTSVYSDKVRVNQVGYLRFASKVGVVVDSSTTPLEWQVQDAAGSVIVSGMTSVYGNDGASADHVHQADFSSLSDLGAYKLVVDGIGSSFEFHIAPSLYPNLPHEAMNYFYFHRMGMEIEGQHLIDDRYARAALHPADTNVPAYPGWCSTCDDFDLFGSWADAGDFGVYTVNHAISAWTLLNLHEMFPEAFVDGTLNLPESANGFPDVLDEVDFGSRFIRGMLPSDGGLASHKAHNHAWSAFTITIEAENQENAAGTRSAMGSSTPATYAVARVNAQLARMWSANNGDPAHIATLWNAAKDAWARADGTSKTYNAAEASPGPAMGGGDYPDGQTGDDRYAAACEMYLSAYALSDPDVVMYKAATTNSQYFGKMGQWDWATVTGAGTLSLHAVDNDLDPADQAWIETNIVEFADKIKMAIDSEGYPSNLNYPSEFGQYPWGSNSFIMNRMIALAYAYEITSNADYHKYLLRSMDYIMGTNAMDISYVTGYGEKAETDTHDRWAWTIGQDGFWPKGWLSGGPNNELINDYETPGGVAAAKSYAAPGTAPHAWGSKENTVNWNAPLAWTAWYIENKVTPSLGGCGGNCPPLADSLSTKLQMNTPITTMLSASDYDGTIVEWVIVDPPALGTLSGAAPNLVYTPNTNTVGTDSFTFRVRDNSNEVSNVASVALKIQDCDVIDIFQVPAAYPVFSGSYNYVHVSEDGPSLENMKTPAHNVQWQNPGLHQFSLELEVEPYYLDLLGCMTNQVLSGPEASFTLAGCGISGLDGDYWITQKDGNEVWVEKNNVWAIVFTNDAGFTPEFCRSSGPTPPTPATPNPTSNPTKFPTNEPTNDPTNEPTNEPTKEPTNNPTKAPSDEPTLSPTKKPVTTSPTSSGPMTSDPTTSPTRNPTDEPSVQPTNSPTKSPSNKPTPEPTNEPTTAQPTKNPTPEPTNEPTTAQPTVCCADRHTGYQVCNSNPWCSENAQNCGNCGGTIMSVPLERTGCCSWGGDCSGYDPTNNYGCQYLQSDCEGSCWGTWHSF